MISAAVVGATLLASSGVRDTLVAAVAAVALLGAIWLRIPTPTPT